jgi:lysine-specific demethylase 3
MTSIFSSSWMCRLCGREACAECFATVTDITTDRPGADHAEVIALQVKREKHAHNNPFFLACTRRNEHQAKDFSPMSRFCEDELEKAITEMERLMKEDGTMAPEGETDGQELAPQQPQQVCCYSLHLFSAK